MRQHTERKLWKKFRKANDIVFNRRQQAKQEQNEAYQAQKQQAQTLLSGFKQSINKAKSSDQLKQLKTDLAQQWHELEKPQQLLNHEYSHLLQNIDDKVKQLQFKTVLNELDLKQELDGIYTQLEQEKIDQEQADKLAEKLLNEDLTAFFQPRLESNTASVALADMLIQAEFISGLETPAEFMEDRMAYQVKVLSARMSGEKVPNNQEQALNWLNQWLLCPKTDASFMQKQGQRIKQAIKAMIDLMTQ